MRECYACRQSPGLLAGLCADCARSFAHSPAVRAHAASRRALAERYDAAARLRRRVNAEGASTCNECGGHFPAESIEIDHFTPLSAGGTDTDDNVRALCTGCHRTKTRREQSLVQ